MIEDHLNNRGGILSMNIDEILEDTADLAQEDIQTPIYRFDIDRILEQTDDLY
jgi:hypothetical protein